MADRLSRVLPPYRRATRQSSDGRQPPAPEVSMEPRPTQVAAPVEAQRHRAHEVVAIDDDRDRILCSLRNYEWGARQRQ